MTYQEAKKTATKENAKIVYTGDAGNGHTFEVYYCPIRGRQIWATVTKEGIKIL